MNLSGKTHKMYCYVGDHKARNFKAMSCPFRLEPNKQAMWNSLAVIDTGVVVAVASIGGVVSMMKGYPKSQFHASYATPKVDGLQLSDDGYSSQTGSEVFMGCETGTPTCVDFAYDADSLYIFAQVFDSTLISQGGHPDSFSFYIQADGVTTDAPTLSSYRIECHPMDRTELFRGDGLQWKPEKQACHVEATRTASYYCLEIAVDWKHLGLKSAPRKVSPRVNIEITNSNGTTDTVERIPDALPSAPWTWMPLVLSSSSVRPLHEVF